MNEQGKQKSVSQKTSKKETSFQRDLLMLLLKIVILVCVFAILFTYVFGFYRNQSVAMEPALKDGDVVVYFGINNKIHANDLVVVKYLGKTMVERVIAVEGDEVDIDKDGLIVNGAHVQEQGIYSETTQFEDGVDFPLTVGYGRLFVLGDNREHATDSRIFGCIKEKDIKGKVIGIFRRRNL